MMIHYFLIFISLFFWKNMFSKYWSHKNENFLAIINNSQLIIFLLLGFNFHELTIYTFEGNLKINLFVTFSLYISLGYNLIDIVIQTYKKKFAFVLHHISLIPFIYGYLMYGLFYPLQIIYTFLEISSLSYNLRNIYPFWGKFHPYLYLLIRSIGTPWFIHNYLLDIFILPFPLFLTSLLSVTLLTIFNLVSIKIILKSK